MLARCWRALGSGVVSKRLMQRQQIFRYSRAQPTSDNVCRLVPFRSAWSSTCVIEDVDHNATDPLLLATEQLSHMSGRLQLGTELPSKLATTAQHYYKLGFQGKTLSPTVLLLMSSLLSTDKSEEWKLQAMVEVSQMIHGASVVHNEVMDASEAGNNKMAIMAGNLLLVKATETLSKLRHHEVIGLMSQVIEHLEIGEVMRIDASFDKCFTIDYYLDHIFYKSASLTASSCKCIALLGGHPEGVASAAFEYGQHITTADRIVDDLQYLSTSKTPLRGGLPTAPLIFALEEHKAELEPLIKRKFEHPGDLETAFNVVMDGNGISRSKELAGKHASKALDAIAALPSDPCRKALDRLTEQVLVTR